MSRFKVTAIVIIVILVTVAAKIYILSRTESPAQIPQKGYSQNPVEVPKKLNISISREEKEQFSDQKKQLTDEIMTLNEFPDGIEIKLNEFSSKMNSTQLNILKEEIADTSLNQDSRAMSMELLTRHKTQESLDIMEFFLSDKNYDTKNDFEKVIRAQAIEGIAHYPDKDKAIFSLERLEAKEQNLFLADRLRRSVVGLRFNKPIEKQDEEALKNLLEQK